MHRRGADEGHGPRVIRGKKIKTTLPDKAQPCPLDKVNRQFRVPAPDMLWVSDFTYVAAWQGFVYVAFVIDAFARRIVGWRVSRTAHAGFVLDALEQAVHQRRPGAGLVHHSDRGSQYLSIKYTERLAEAGIEPSVGSVGDSYDNALAETINGLFKAEVIHRRGPGAASTPWNTPHSRPIDFRLSPLRQRSHSSALWAAVNPTRWHFLVIAIAPHPLQKGCVATIS
jgi:transposase InsO family protein